MYRVIGSIFGYAVGDLIDLSTASPDTLDTLTRTGAVVAVEDEEPAQEPEPAAQKPEPKAKGKA